MPSSDFNMIPKVLSVVLAIEPDSILDVGVGNGRYGHLFRECFDWNWGRIEKNAWELMLCGVEIDPTYLTPVHEYVYDKIFVCDWFNFEVQRQFDLIFLGDVLEHWPDGKWRQALEKAKELSKYTIVVSPNWKGSLAQQSWHGHHQEKHWSILSPKKVGGRCLFASSKMFMCVFDNRNTGILNAKDLLL
jgi:SAM-dependent methyltransferase